MLSPPGEPGQSLRKPRQELLLPLLASSRPSQVMRPSEGTERVAERLVTPDPLGPQKVPSPGVGVRGAECSKGEFS